jgi:2-methylcitrate dehydratase PrpD
VMQRTHRLARFITTLQSAVIPPAVTARALDLLTDLLGSAIRASKEADSTPSILAMVERMGLQGEGHCTVFGLDRRYGPAAAALLNGAFGHSLDFDDTHAASSLHPSAPVVPAALAAAQITGASGADLLAAVVVGFETCCRLGMALDPASHYARGFHPTATAGTLGACAAAGRLLGLDEVEMQSALGVAASQASGSLQFLVNGAWNKRYQVGDAAMKGLIAATLASEGFKGSADAIDGKHGFLTGYTDDAKPARAVANLGEVWETMHIGVKPYPSCRYTHAAVDGILTLVRRKNLKLDDIESVTVGLHRNGIVLVGEPLVDKRRVRNTVAGQFSMPFAAAVALLRGGFGWDDYELIGNPQVDALSDRVEVVRDHRLESASHPFGASVTIRARGAAHNLLVADPSGEPGTFPTPEASAAKFLTLARPVLNGGADAMFERIRDLPQASDLRTWFSANA